MNRLFLAAACMASALAAAPMPALSRDLSPEEGAELRERANHLLAERQRNPAWDGGTTRLSQTRSDVPLDRDRGEVKMPRQGEVKPKVKGSKKPKREAIRKRMKRAVKEVPGAFVRRR